MTSRPTATINTVWSLALRFGGGAGGRSRPQCEHAVAARGTLLRQAGQSRNLLRSGVEIATNSHPSGPSRNDTANAPRGRLLAPLGKGQADNAADDGAQEQGEPHRAVLLRR